MDTDVAGLGFEVLFYSNPQPMWILDIYTLYFLEVNDAAQKRYGYTKEEFLNKTIYDLRPKSEFFEVEKALSDIQGHNTNHKEFKHLAKNGTVLSVSITSYSMTYQGRRARLVHAHNLDEEKNIANKLETTQSKLEHILENTTIGFCQLDLNWHITYWNQASEQLIGYKREHVIGKNIWAVLPELLQTSFYVNCGKAYEEGLKVETLEYYWPVQKWFSIAVYRAEEGLTIHFRDSTHKKLFEEALINKIDQLKEVSFFNSHYIRKPVASLLGLTYLINENLVNESEFKKLAEYIHESGKELDQVLKTMNEIVNDNNVSYLSQELNNFCFEELMAEVIEDLQHKYPSNAINRKSKADVLFYGNKKAIQVAIESLVDNAVKFSAQGSAVYIHTGLVDQSLVITVQDSGMGMSTNTVNELFECFHNKKLGSCLGAGLTRVIDIAQKHNGYVWVESKINEGSVFNLRLPLSNIAAYKVTGQPNFSVYKLPEIKVQYNYSLKCLQVEWLGFHDANSVKMKCMAITKALHQTQAAMLLIDNSKLMGVWEGAVDWIVNEWYPQIEQNGISKIAVVYSPSTFSKLSAQNIKKRHRSSINMETFHQHHDAIQWLSQFTSMSV